MSRIDSLEHLTCEELLYLASFAQETERGADLAKYAVALVNRTDCDLSVQERSFLSTGYKNEIGTLRASWRMLCSFESREEVVSNADNQARAKQYRQQIESELSELCTQVVNLVDERLIPHVDNGESRVFYYKMKADCMRYMCEYTVGTVRQEHSQDALHAYQTATVIAANELPPTHPIRLGLALNFAVFHYEILGDSAQGQALSKQAFDAALAELDNVPEQDYQEITSIMQLLR